LLAELRIPWPTRTLTTSPDIASGEKERSIDRLSDEELLVYVACWQGITTATRPAGHRPAATVRPGASRHRATEYANGSIGSSRKSRGLGECWGRPEWTWNGKRFIPTAEKQHRDVPHDRRQRRMGSADFADEGLPN
jgi:hypothetical protein